MGIEEILLEKQMPLVLCYKGFIITDREVSLALLELLPQAINYVRAGELVTCEVLLGFCGASFKNCAEVVEKKVKIFLTDLEETDETLSVIVRSVDSDETFEIIGLTVASLPP